MSFVSTPFLAPRKGFFISLLVAPTALWVILAPCQARAAEPADLGTVLVEERSPAKSPSRDATAAATVIVPAESPDPTDTVPDLLERTAGVSLRRYGGLDDFSAISLRGSTASQVQIYLDDIPLVSAAGDLVDLSILPMNSIDAVEVYRGGSPGTVPDATDGGVIIIRTKGRPEKGRFYVGNTGGSFTTYRGSVDAAAPLGKGSFIASYERFQSEGDFTYLDDMGTTHNPSDDKIETRENNDFASNSLFLKMTFDPDERTRISASNVFFNKGQGIPGLGSRTSLTARLETWRDMVSVTAERDFASAPGLFGHADLFFDFLNSQFSDPQGNIGVGGPQDNDDNTYRGGLNGRLSYAWGSHQILRFFAAGRGEFYLPDNRTATPPGGPHSRRYTVAAGAEDEIRFFSERLVVVPSLRLTSLFNDLVNQLPQSPSVVLSTNRRSDYQLSAKLGLKARLVSELYFKGNFYRGFRNPSFSELFGNRGTIVGNPELRPEEALNFDAGLAYHYKGDELAADAEATYFRNDVRELIQYVQTSQFTVRPQNVGRALIQGAELSARLSFGTRFGAYASYTFEDARNTGGSPATEGKAIPGRPRHELASGANWKEGWLPWFSTRLFADLNFISGNYLDTQNLIRVNSRTLLAAGLTASFVDAVSVTFTVKNILNDRIEDVVGYPLPGRSYWGTIELRI